MIDNTLVMFAVLATGAVGSVVAQSPELLFDGTSTGAMSVGVAVLWRLGSTATQVSADMKLHCEREREEWAKQAAHRDAEREHWHAG